MLILQDIPPVACCSELRYTQSVPQSAPTSLTSLLLNAEIEPKDKPDMKQIKKLEAEIENLQDQLSKLQDKLQKKMEDSVRFPPDC